MENPTQSHRGAPPRPRRNDCAPLTLVRHGRMEPSMKHASIVGVVGMIAFGLAVGRATQSLPAGTVNVVRLPERGIQPQVATDASGGVHVVYFAGEPANGDLFYARLNNGAFSPPIRVNSEPASAIAVGTIRGARLALGRNGRAHVAWNGSSKITPKGGPTPMLYTRMNDSGTGFEPQRNVMQFATGIDGGGALAADGRGNVHVAWHAGGPDSKGEGDRRVWLASSTDDGRTFARERPISNIETGACGCCGMDGLVSARGDLFFLYRSARDVVNRDSYLLASTDAGRTFRSTLMQPWNVGACPMSSYDLIERDAVVLAAWETGGQVQFARVALDVMSSPVPIVPHGASKTRRHPSLAINGRGEVLMSWSEGTGWQRGGSVAWQLFDPAGAPKGVGGLSEGMPVWGLSAAFARPDNGFTIVY